ncbi:MAG: hypothetical protein WKF36_09500 [Candidatus Nitrosocosmicus sp.]
MMPQIDLIAISLWQTGCFSIRGGTRILFGMCNCIKKGSSTMKTESKRYDAFSQCAYN